VTFFALSYNQPVRRPTGQIVSTLTLSGGSLLAIGMTKANSSTANIGTGLILAGIALQLLWFLFFMAVSASFHRRMLLRPTTIVQRYPEIRWQRYLGSLYFVSMMIVVRSIFRLVEFAGGSDGYLQTHEVFFYVFDSVPMLIVMVWMNFEHPGETSQLLKREELKRFESATNELI
jgi:hypothetical protein